MSVRFRLVLFSFVLFNFVLFTSKMVLAVDPFALQPASHKFFDKQNISLFSENTAAQTAALLAIQSHGDYLESRGRTVDKVEKHFESYGYGWGAAYRYGGGVGLNMFISYMFHATGHHKLERWVPVLAIGHAAASTGYALRGSREGVGGW